MNEERNPCVEVGKTEPTEQHELIGIEEIFSFADFIREQSVKELKERGHVHRVCWVFTTSEFARKLPQGHVQMEQMMGGNGDPTEEEKARKDPNTPAIVAVDLSPGDDGLVNMMCELFPKLAEGMGAIMALGDLMGV